MTALQCVVDTPTDHLAPPQKIVGGEVSALICMAQEISEKRSRLLREMKALLLSDQYEAVIEKARELCGLKESDRKGEEVSNGSPK